MSSGAGSPDLASYDYILIQSSAGKDSQAMTDVVHERAVAAGVQDRLILVHCDLGRVEWAGTKELAQEHATHYGMRFEVVKSHWDLLDLILKRGKWPSSTERYCTSTVKRDACGPLYTRLSRERELGRQVRILNCMGMRAEESPARSKLVPFSNVPRYTTGNKLVDLWLPIHSWTVAQVWERNKAAGTRTSPVYSLGFPRLSCIFCFYAPEDVLVAAAYRNPELFESYLQAERSMGHTFKNKWSLERVRERLEKGDIPKAEDLRDWKM